MTLRDVKLITARRHPPLSPDLIRIRYADPAWYANAIELYARRRADRHTHIQQEGSKT
jgi:hypothetical protein